MRKKYQQPYVRVAMTLTLASCGFFSVGGIQVVRATEAMVREVNAEPIGRSVGRIPLSFDENRGQADPPVKFLSHGPGYSLLLSPGSLVLAFSNLPEKRTREHSLSSRNQPTKALTLKLVGSDSRARIEGPTAASRSCLGETHPPVTIESGIVKLASIGTN